MDVNDRQRSGAPAPSDPVYDLAPVSHEWSPAGALTRLQRHTTGDDGGRDERTYRSAFAGGLDALPIADVVNGKLHVVPAAVFRAAALLPSLGLEAEEAGRVRAELGRHYARMDRTPPWERSGDCLELFERFLSVRIEPDTGAIPEDQRADLHKALVQIARLVGPYEGQTLPFADVARYLDAEIASWRERRERGDTEAHHYLNALQAARTALLGRPLAAEPESPAVDAERLEDVSRRTEEAERLLAETQGV